MSESFLFHKINDKALPDNIEWKIRHRLFKWFGVFMLTDLLPFRLRFKIKDFYYNHIRSIFAPAHKRIRKSIPRQWNDLTSIIVQVNFEIIKSFYEDEFLQDTVDWTATDEHKKFAKWLKKSYEYITVKRPILEKAELDAYPNEDIDALLKMPVTKKSYNKLYGGVIKIQREIEQKDTKILKEMVEYRDRFWT